MKNARLTTLRKALAVGFPIAGTILVFLALLLPTISVSLRTQIAVVLLGLIIIQAGVWRLTPRILPDERRYLALRAEVNTFVDRIRVLNAQGVRLRAEDSESARDAFLKTLDDLHDAVDRMADAAGREQ